MDDVFSISGRLVLVLALVAANGLFVAAEFAIVTTRRARIDNLAAQGNPVAAGVRRTLRPFGLRPADGIAHSVHTAEEINLLVSQSAEAGVLESEEAKLLASVFQFGDRRVNEVMIPRTEVVWLERGTAIRDFYRTFAETPHSRFPVFENSQDNVVGIVGIKDVLRGVAEGQLTEDSP